MKDIVLLILQVVAVVVNIYIAFTKKKNVYIATFIFNTTNLFVYIWLQDTTSIVSYTLISVRSLIYMYKDKLKLVLLPTIFIVLHIILGIFTLESPVQLLAILAPCMTCAYMWFAKDEQQLRIGNVVVALVWLIFNLALGLYGLVISRFISIIANTISYIKNK